MSNENCCCNQSTPDTPTPKEDIETLAMAINTVEAMVSITGGDRGFVTKARSALDRLKDNENAATRDIGTFDGSYEYRVREYKIEFFDPGRQMWRETSNARHPGWQAWFAKQILKVYGMPESLVADITQNHIECERLRNERDTARQRLQTLRDALREAVEVV